MNNKPLSDSAKAFGYEEPVQRGKTVLPTVSTESVVDLPQAIITAASALGKDNQQVARLLHDNKLQLEQVDTADGTYLQLNDISKGDSTPLYHIQSNQPLTNVEEAARSFDRLGHKDLYRSLMVEASKATNWGEAIL